MSNQPSQPTLREARSYLPRFDDRLPLGQNGLEVSPFCIGIVHEEEVVLEAFDAGINFFFFSADMHWPLYERTRRGLSQLLQRGGGIRDEIVIAVVCYVTQPVFSWAPFREAMEAVSGLDRLDVAVAGGAYGNEICDRLKVYHGKHQREGYLGCRAIGSTFHDRAAALMVTNHGLTDISFIRYNAAHPGARRDIFPHLRQDSPTLLYNFKNLMGFVDPVYFPQLDYDANYWQPKITDHYRFVLSRPELDGILCAPTEVHMVEELAEAMEEGPLDGEEEQFLIDLAQTGRSRAGEIVPIDPGTGQPTVL